MVIAAATGIGVILGCASAGRMRPARPFFSASLLSVARRTWQPFQGRPVSPTRNGDALFLVETPINPLQRPIGILYEHPLWFEPLFSELERRGVPFERIAAERHTFDPGDRENPYSLVVNRMSPSAWTRGHAHAIFHTLHYLAYLDEIGAKVVNGHEAFQFEISKARQIALFARLGVSFPASRVVNDAAEAAEAAEELRFPVVVKPNIGGSGAGIRAFETFEELAEEAASGTIDLGLDASALVQEQLPARDESVVRIEILGGEFLYAIRLRLMPGSFNLCPADYCELPGIADGISGRGVPIEAYDPPLEVIEDAKRVVAGAGMDLGGVEYLVDDRDGLPYFYDVNALSNFVANAQETIGFDPFVDLADFLVERAAPGGRGFSRLMERRYNVA